MVREMLMTDWCKPCAERGITTIAHRIVVGTPMCNPCFRGEMPSRSAVLSKPFVAQQISHLGSKKEKSTTKRKQIDWDAVQRDRDAGIAVSELVKKFGVSNPSIYTKTHGNGNRGGRKRPKIQKRAQRFNGADIHARPGESLLDRARGELAHHEHMCKQVRAVIELLEGE